MTTPENVAALKQPPVFKLAFLTAMCERFGYYVLSFLVTLYAKQALGFSDGAAFALFSIFTAIAYITPPLGGYLADNVFGIRRCIALGLTLEGVGLILLAIPNKFVFALAMAMVAVGVGFFKTGPTHLMGRSYSEKDPRIDSGFTLYYMGMNMGALLPSLAIGIVQRYYGWGTSFIIGGIGILCGLLFYGIFKSTANEIDSDPGKQPLAVKKLVYLVAGLIVTLCIASYLISDAKVAQLFIGLGSAGALLYFIYQIFVSPKEEKLKIVACIVLILTGMVFFIIYLQLFTSIELFINRCVSRTIMGFEIPTVAYFSLNCFFVIIFSPILAKIYHALEKRGKDLSITTKFSLGLLIAALSFFSLIVGIEYANNLGQVSSWWTVLAYLLITLGELLISALGVAMVTRIAPKRMYGIMMGTWFLVGMSLAATIAKVFADLSSVPDTMHDPFMILQIYKGAFLKTGLVCLGCTAVSFILGPFVKRIAKID